MSAYKRKGIVTPQLAVFAATWRHRLPADAPLASIGVLLGVLEATMFTICRAVLASVSLALPMAILPPPVGAQGFDLAAAKVVDLTHSIDASTIFWPT
jgi:hypothetical protein